MDNIETDIKSPLRYPGGKTRAVKRILPLIPEYDEFREPMVGGGSVFFALKQKHPDKKYWINDINTELYYFWKYTKEEPDKLVAEIRNFKKEHNRGKDLYQYLKHNKENLTDIQRGARFFILNRITFSGLMESGGYSKQAFKKRFTESSIDRIYSASKVLQGVRITNSDYWDVIKQDGDNTFLFLDPPYLSKVEAKLYGVKGRLHINFKHADFAKHIKKSKHRWLITYDDCSGVQKLYTFANAVEMNIQGLLLQYGTNNGAKNIEKKRATIGKELFIFNYKVKADK
jgi:DNA adenine methylase